MKDKSTWMQNSTTQAFPLTLENLERVREEMRWSPEEKAHFRPAPIRFVLCPYLEPSVVWKPEHPLNSTTDFLCGRDAWAALKRCSDGIFVDPE